jgi:hypothetical protein
MRPLVLSILLFAACDPVTPTGDLQGLMQPRPEPLATVAPALAPLAADNVLMPEPSGFDFDADAPEDGPVDADALGDMSDALGIDPDADTDSVVPDAEPMMVEDFAMLELEPVVAPSTPISSPVATPVFQPVVMGFGVRLVSTTSQSQPPRAILGLTDGREIVVEPGMMLPDEHLVVLAIGQDSIQIAEITPMGDRAKVESRVLQAMYRQGSDGQ